MKTVRACNKVQVFLHKQHQLQKQWYQMKILLWRAVPFGTFQEAGTRNGYQADLVIFMSLTQARTCWLFLDA
jgi:hypothetical protein